MERSRGLLSHSDGLDAFGRAPIAPIIDAMILEGLGDQNRPGKVRLWGLLGYGGSECHLMVEEHRRCDLLTLG